MIDPFYRQEIIVCGWDEVFILDLDQQADGKPRKVWSWRAANCADLPDSFKSLFETTDDCKPFDQGQKVLITSSGGAVAYVDRGQDRVLFYGRAANAHSADILPNDRIAVAASHDSHGQGDRLILFDMHKPDQPLWSGPLSWGHGVFWDAQRQHVWALAEAEVRIYQLRDWNTTAPKLEHVSTITLPESCGHDLYPVPDTPRLSITTSNRCWLLDRNTRVLSNHPALGDSKHVKCICQHPRTKQTVYVQGEGENWWADSLHFLHPEDRYHVPGGHFYKARWSIRVG